MKKSLLRIFSRLIRPSLKSSASPKREKTRPSESSTGPLLRPGDSIAIIVGLGNPGPEYVRTRHNVGFEVVEEFARTMGATPWVEGDLSAECRVDVGDGELLLVRPLTFMNRSGDAVTHILGRCGAEPSQMVVIVDDVDLPLGKLRLRPRGGPGTHNGLRSLNAAVGQEFPRLRVGVRGDSLGDDLADYVLSPFAPEERVLVEEVVGRAAAGLKLIVDLGVEAAMNEVNRQTTQRET